MKKVSDVYMMSLSKNERKQDFTFVYVCICLEICGWKHEKPRTEVIYSGGGQGVCSAGSWASDRRTLDVQLLLSFGFLTI